jgi:hypothetical protein
MEQRLSVAKDNYEVFCICGRIRKLGIEAI